MAEQDDSSVSTESSGEDLERKQSLLDVVRKASKAVDPYSKVGSPDKHWSRRNSSGSLLKSLVAKHSLHKIDKYDRRALQDKRIVDPTRELVTPFKSFEDQGSFIRVFQQLRRFFDGDEYERTMKRDWWAKWMNVHAVLQEEHRQVLQLQLQAKAVEVLEELPPGQRPPGAIAIVLEWAATADAFAKVDRESVVALAQRATVRRVPKGCPLFFQGSKGDAYWVLMSGELGLFAKTRAAGEEDPMQYYRNIPEQQLVDTAELLETDVLGFNFANVGSGKGLGELSIINKGTRRACAAVACSENCVAMRITPQLYNDHLKKGHKQAAAMGPKIEMVKSISYFSHWAHEDVTRLVYTLKDESFNRGAVIAAPGDKMTRIMIIASGSVHLMHPKGNVEVAALGPRDIIGLESLGGRAGFRPGKAGWPECCFTTRLVARTSVKVHWVEVDEAFKFFSGAHGSQSLFDIKNLMHARRRFRAEHFRAMRSHQKKTARQRKEVLAPNRFHSLIETSGPACPSDSVQASVGLGLEPSGSVLSLSATSTTTRSQNTPTSRGWGSLPRDGSSIPVPHANDAAGVGAGVRPKQRPLSATVAGPAAAQRKSPQLTASKMPASPIRRGVLQSHLQHQAGADPVQFASLPTLVSPTSVPAVTTVHEMPTRCTSTSGARPMSASLAYHSGWQARRQPVSAVRGLSNESAESTMESLKSQIAGAESNMRVAAALMNRGPRRKLASKEKLLTCQEIIQNCAVSMALGHHHAAAGGGTRRERVASIGSLGSMTPSAQSHHNVSSRAAAARAWT